MNKNELVRRLAKIYADEPQARWKMAETAADFLPCPAGRRVVQLSPDATMYIINNIVGRNSKQATFIMIECEGDIRISKPDMFEDWALAVRIALDEGNYIYNARSKSCSRPIWHGNIAAASRLLDNMTFEPVRLVADTDTYDAEVPRVNTRLFSTEG